MQIHHFRFRNEISLVNLKFFNRAQLFLGYCGGWMMSKNIITGYFNVEKRIIVLITFAHGTGVACHIFFVQYFGYSFIMLWKMIHALHSWSYAVLKQFSGLRLRPLSNSFDIV